MIITGFRNYPTRKVYTRTKKSKLNYSFDISLINYLIKEVDDNIAKSNRNTLNSRIDNRIAKIRVDYDNKVNRLLDTLIIRNDLELFSLENLDRLVNSVMRVTKSLNESIISVVTGLGGGTK